MSQYRAAQVMPSVSPIVDVSEGKQVAANPRQTLDPRPSFSPNSVVPPLPGVQTSVDMAGNTKGK